MHCLPFAKGQWVLRSIKMNTFKISIKNFRFKPLYTFLAILTLSVSIALLLGIQQIDKSLQLQMENSLGKVDMVVGAKGSPLQLVLSSVLHIDHPTGNIPLEQAKSLIENRMVEKAVPISYGDNYKGYRIVGTTDDFATLYDATLIQGRSVENPMEVVLGAAVAEKTGLGIGDTFRSSHGLIEEGGHEHAAPLTVVGVYSTTHKVIDRLIITGLRTIWDVHHHHADESNEKEETSNGHHQEEAHRELEITSLLISFRSPMALLTIPREINKKTNMQAALPKYELERLHQFTGVGVKTVTWIAYGILIISCITIFISLYRMVWDRAFDLALMRTYGAHRFQLVKMIAYEGFLIAGTAFVLGVLLSQIGVLFIFKMIKTQYQQNIPLELRYHELLQIVGLVLIVVLMAIIFAIYPIVKMNISRILSHEK